MSIQGPSSLKRRKEHRLVYEVIRESELTVQVLDARFPLRCRSLMIDEIVKSLEKPMIYCISKTDLIPQDLTLKWKKILSKHFPTVHISAKDRNGTTILRKKIFQNSPFHASPERPVTISIVGYPNVGKSSLINVLAGRHSAPVSPNAGYTRSIRKVKITPKLFLIDTPGVSPTDILTVNEKVYLGAISPEDIIDPDLVVEYLFKQAIAFHQQESWEIYLKTPLNNKFEDILEKFARSRGFISKGNQSSILEASRVIIRDFIKGKINYYENPDYLLRPY
ncbi:MAG: GTPase [Candidatus Thorarchaeota archaeon]